MDTDGWVWYPTVEEAVAAARGGVELVATSRETLVCRFCGHAQSSVQIASGVAPCQVIGVPNQVEPSRLCSMTPNGMTTTELRSERPGSPVG